MDYNKWTVTYCSTEPYAHKSDDYQAEEFDTLRDALEYADALEAGSVFGDPVLSLTSPNGECFDDRSKLWSDLVNGH